MKLTLTFVKRYNKTSREGKPYVSLSIKAKEYGDKYLSGFGNKQNESWKEGDTVEVAEVATKGEYLNFEMPKTSKESADAGMLADIRNRQASMEIKIDKIVKHLSGVDRLDRTSDGKPMPNFDIDPADIPLD